MRSLLHPNGFDGIILGPKRGDVKTFRRGSLERDNTASTIGADAFSGLWIVFFYALAQIWLILYNRVRRQEEDLCITMP